MAVTSTLFQDLESRAIALQTKFLFNELAKELQNPLTFQPDLDQLAAFKLLVHAEIEDYIERKAKASLASLKTSFVVVPFSIRANLHIYALASTFGVELSFGSPFEARCLEEALEKLLRAGQEFVSNNNGIKEQSFFNVAMLTGKMPDEMDVSLMAMLNQYGKERGDIAHKSTTRVGTISAPSTEKKTAEDLITALGQFFYGP